MSEVSLQGIESEIVEGLEPGGRRGDQERGVVALGHSRAEGRAGNTLKAFCLHNGSIQGHNLALTVLICAGFARQREEKKQERGVVALGCAPGGDPAAASPSPHLSLSRLRLGRFEFKWLKGGRRAPGKRSGGSGAPRS